MPVGYRECNHRRQLIRQGLFYFRIQEEESEMTYLNRVIESPAPQSEALPGMVPNSAGGHAYPVDDFTRLRRFLVLGSEGGSYYASERKLTLENAGAVRRCIDADGPAAVREIVAVSEERRAPRVATALFALALAASYGGDETRGLAFETLPRVARTGSHLHEFAGYADAMRGWGRGLRRAVADWYAARPVADAVYQAVKYRNRYGWTHRDLLRKAHAKAEGPLNELFAWVTQGTLPSEDPALRLVHAFEQAKTADADTLAALIREHRMSWEMVPAEMMDRKEVWQALSEDMPVTAYIRNLATMTRLGAISPMESARACDVLGRIGTGSGRIHPIGVLSALLTYRGGRGVRGQHVWEPVSQVVDALDAAFERSFSQAPQTGSRLYLGIDVSGSMGHGEVAGVPGLTPRMAAAAMAMAVARREPNHYLAAFASRSGTNTRNRRDTEMAPLDITARDSIADAAGKTQALPFGGTDCALPMLDALNKGIPVDCFVVLTDSETWAGQVHPREALRRYREETGLAAKLVVVAMVSNGFSIADPEDGGMLDVVGFDAAAPQLIADFASL